MLKNTLKFICSFICYLLFIPCLLLTTIGITWYILPAFQTTFIGDWLLGICTETDILIGTIVSAICSLVFWVLSKRFTVIKNSKVLNFYTHIVTWLAALVLMAETIFTFAISDTLSTASFDINLIRKIGIGTGVISMFLYTILSPKLRTLVNRKIQAYDTAKELNTNGRSSVVWVNILKTVDFICPEIILLGMLCFAFNLEIAIYFIVLICALIIPCIGNMICDKRVKKEAVKKKEEEREILVNEIANAVHDLNKEQK